MLILLPPSVLFPFLHHKLFAAVGGNFGPTGQVSTCSRIRSGLLFICSVCVCVSEEHATDPAAPGLARSNAFSQMDGCLSRHTHTHTLLIFPFMGLLPNATFGPNYQVVSISWTRIRFPSVKLLMRFGLATVRLSICQLTLPFCLSGTRKETRRTPPSLTAPSILATGRPPGRTPCFTPPVFTAQTAVSASRCLQAHTETCYFQVTTGGRPGACVGRR